jgi:hypothetical protein
MGQEGRLCRTEREGKITEIQLHGVIVPLNEQFVKERLIE